MEQLNLETIAAALFRELRRQGGVSRREAFALLQGYGLSDTEALAVIAYGIEAGIYRQDGLGLLSARLEPPSVPPPAAGRESKHCCQRSVLVVEDDADCRSSLAQSLADEGYDVHFARNGIEALAVLGQIPRPCVVLLDLMMPGLDGWDLLDVMKRTEYADLPIAIVSAFADRAPKDRPLIRKPIDLRELLTTVRAACL